METRPGRFVQLMNQFWAAIPLFIAMNQFVEDLLGHGHLLTLRIGQVERQWLSGGPALASESGHGCRELSCEPA